MTEELTNRINADSYLSKQEAAAYLNCSVKSLERMMSAGLPHYSITRNPLFKKSDLDAYAQQFRKGAA